MEWGVSEDCLTPNVRALVGSPKRIPRLPRIHRLTQEGVGSNRENGQQGGPMRRSFSKSASDLLNRSRTGSGERSGDNSPGGSPPLEARKGGEGERPRVSLANKPSAAAFFNTLRTKFHRTRSKDGKLSRRKDILLDGVRSNSHPDVSVERQDSTTDYAADNSSAEHSSSCTPVSMSPRRGPLLAQNRQNSQDVGGSTISGAPDTGDLSSVPSGAHPSSLTPPTPARGHGGMNSSPLLQEQTESDSPQQASSSGTVYEVWSQEIGICDLLPVPVLYPVVLGGTGTPWEVVLDPTVLRHRALRQYSFFQLHVHLKRGEDLVARDACGKLLPQYSSYQSGDSARAGTSDPYVKFKVSGKLVYKSKTVYKDLNPTWDESFTIGIEDPFEPVSVKVFDYDWGLQDDFMGLAHIDLTTLELDKTQEITLTLQEPGKTKYMGVIYLSLTLQPKTQEEKEQYLQRGGSRLAEQQRRLKSQIWSSVVTIVLVEGKELLPMDPDGTSDPYVKFRLGNEKYKSKVEMHTLTPKWLEQFDFHLFEDQSQLLELTVWDKDVRSKDDFMGRCTLDLTQYEREKTHHIWAELEKGAGSIFLLLTISGTTSSETISDLHSYQENPRELENVSNRYTVTRSLHNLKDIGQLRVKVYRAQGLAAADIGGKSDPFCVLELCNARLQTQTEYKTLSPTWNKIFTFNVKDIHNVLDITVYDEDRDHKVEFLGKVVIPLLRMKNGEKKWYPLKDKKLRARAKGNNPEILLECSVEWNPIRAAIRTFTPREEKYMQTEQKFKRQVFIKNVNRLKSSIMDFYELGKFIKSCWEWESPVRSIIAFILFMVITYYFEVYMLPILLLMLFLRNYIVISIVGSMHREEESELSGDEEEVDDDDKDKNMSVEVRKTESRKECGINASPNDLKSKEEKKTLKERLQVIQEVTATVQNAIGYIASIFESCKNTFNFSVPFLSWLLIMVLMVGSVVLYYIPVRYLVMMWGVNKFSRKLLRPHSMVNNELLDFLSRVPDDELLRDCRELRPIPQSHDEKRRDQRKKKVA
ncbi:multiple C2 and transmembrane domain-containing protein-like isoform X5 [Penaeus japonicus]|uniref:multiple C2 and transmembrane domain-containing protein-like isoform X5 n=1 Tax=Penaeus japonicus TaxID=27405 RepID=UPI001C711072|nr:multiple C2 and transmembrane domain-containing protein-like isoform X5 [Penaeus japonicus]